MTASLQKLALDRLRTRGSGIFTDDSIKTEERQLIWERLGRIEEMIESHFHMKAVKKEQD